MKIVNIHRLFIDERTGGLTVYNHDLCSHLSRRNDMEVHHIAGTRDINKKSYEPYKGFHLHRIHLTSRFPIINYFHRLLKTKHIVENINRESKIDVIFFHEAGLTAALKYAGELKNIPQVYFFHAPHSREVVFDFNKIKKGLKGFGLLLGWLRTRVYSLKFRISESQSIKHAQKVIVMSKYNKQTIEKYYGFRSEKVEAIPIGVDTDIYRPPLDKGSLRQEMGMNGKIVFFALRRLEPRMGLGNLISAFRDLNHEIDDKTILFIGGKGTLIYELEATAREFGLENNIKFLGFLNESEKIKHLQSADAVIVPSEDLEGFGIVNIEAMACNTPVIGTNVGAIPEILSGIAPELIAENPSPMALKEKMKLFIENLEDYQNKERSRLFNTYTIENYAWEKICLRLINVVNEILNKS